MDSNLSRASARNCVALLVAGMLIIGGSTTASASDGVDTDVLETLQAADASLAMANGKLVASPAENSASKGDDRSLGDPTISVVVPETSGEPVLVGSLGEEADLSIRLPMAEVSAPSIEEGLDVVSYDNGNGSTTVPVAGPSSLQINTIIETPSAPSSYSYDLELVNGGELALTDLGSVAVLNEHQELAYYIEKPWARDANGQDVPTYYSVDEGTLTQHVDLTAPSIVFPVVADPKFVSWPGGVGVRFTKSETRSIGGNGDLASAAAAFCGLVASAPGGVACGIAGIIVVRTKLGPIQRAAAQGRCSQVNMPHGSGPVLWFTYNIAC